MICDCINRIEKMLNEKMAEKYPGGEVIDEVAFVYKGYFLDNEGHHTLAPDNPVLGRVRVGKAIREFKTKVVPNYCPFCGKKIKERNI